MSLSVFYYCICACLRRCRSFNPSLCRLSPFHLSYVAVSRPSRLSEFTPTGPLIRSSVKVMLLFGECLVFERLDFKPDKIYLFASL